MEKKARIKLLIVLLVMLCIPMSVQAAAGSKAKGAQLPSYSTVIERVVTPQDDFDKVFGDYLKEAESNADRNTQYKLIIQPGTYSINKSIYLPSNVWIYAKGAVLYKRSGTAVLRFRQENNKSYENIIIEGGSWDVTKQPAEEASNSSLAMFAHVKNLLVKDATFKSNRYAHILEIGDAQAVTVAGCTFTGNTLYRGSRDVQPKEAFQMDVATATAMGDCLPYNGKGCHNILIENNNFVKVARGLGSHSYADKGAEASPYTDITVNNNKFKNLEAEGIFFLQWKNCTISNNKITRAKRAGIYSQSSKNLKITGNAISNTKAFSGERRNYYGKESNGIFMLKTSKSVLSKNNISKVATAGIRLIDKSVSNKIEKNTLSGSKSAPAISVNTRSIKNTIQGNTLKKSKKGAKVVDLDVLSQKNKTKKNKRRS